MNTEVTQPNTKITQLREQYPTMPEGQLTRLAEAESKLNLGLCRIDEPDCESCQ